MNAWREVLRENWSFVQAYPVKHGRVLLFAECASCEVRMMRQVGQQAAE